MPAEAARRAVDHAPTGGRVSTWAFVRCSFWASASAAGATSKRRLTTVRRLT
jgi:hypothetical protein